MASFKAKQIFLTLGMLASLLVGSASACLCSHHTPEPEKVEAETSSCHSHTKKEKSQQAEISADWLVSSDACVCAASAERKAAKSESTKLKKLAAAIAPKLSPTTETRELAIATQQNFARKPIFLSTAFCERASSRGPPRA